MSSFAQQGKDEEEIQPPQRPPSPPPHTTFAVRGVHVRVVSASFREYRHDGSAVS
jgi:THO complex subunit 3